MTLAITLTARVSDASGNEASAQAVLTVEDVVRDRIDARPNDGTGLWPDFSNTGYQNAPGFPGRVTDWKPGMTSTGWLPIEPASGSTVSFKRFAGKIGIGPNTHPTGVTFHGCLFEGVSPNDLLLLLYTAGRVTFEYCTFKPFGLNAPPGNDGTVSSARSAPGTPYMQSWQYMAKMVGGTVVTMDSCDIWGNAGIQCTGGLSAAMPAIFRGCYIHDQADNDGSGGSGYHHDGLGPDSEGGSRDTVIENCTIASRGNTNGIALQGSSTYSRIRITDCHISGWGYAVSIGATRPWQGTHITVSNNVFSAELPALFGPFYNVREWNNGGGTNLWQGNRYQVRPGDGNGLIPLAAHGQYWWPSDNQPHASDYAN